MAKVLFIGLDSAEPNLMLEWLNSGDLPVLQSLRERGVWGKVQTLAGFGNGVIWPSLFTCVNPAKHGRYYFRQLKPGSYQASLFREDTDFRREPFWAALSRNGHKVAVIDMVRAPLTKDLNGIQLADWMTHDRSGPPRSWPPDLMAKVIADFGADPLGGVSDVRDRGEREYLELCERMLGRIETKTALSCDLLSQGPWDLFMTVFAEPHDVGHQCWHLRDPSHPLYDATSAKKFGDPIKTVCMALDRSIDRLVQAAGPDAKIVVFTCPGMGPGYTGSFLLDQILRRLEGGLTTDGRTYVDTLKSIYRFVVPPSIRDRLHRTAERSEEVMLARDRSRRRYFVVPHNDGSGAIRFNLVGREADGKVEPGPEFEALCNALIQDLRDIVNLETGEPLVADVVRVAERFEGDCLDELPDLLVIWNRKCPIRAVGSPKIGTIRSSYPGNRTGDHTPRGLFFACGPDISPCALRNEVSVMDIGTTIVSWFGVALADSDGGTIPELRRS